MKSTETINLYDLQTRIAADDQAALKGLYELFSKKLHYLAFSFVRSNEVAEEIVEDVFINVWKQREKLPHIENFGWYLYVSTKNTSYSYLRKSNKEHCINLDELSLPYLKLDTNPEDIMVSNEAIQRINLAINNLPPKCRHIFKLVKEDGLKYKQVAELLDINIKTVENQMGIALKKIHSSILIAPKDNIRFSQK